MKKGERCLKKLCDKCQKEISVIMFDRHYRACRGYVRNVVQEAWKLENGKYRCPYCSSERTKAGIGSHIWHSHTEEGRRHPSNLRAFNEKQYKLGIGSWNQGLTKEDPRVQKASDTLREGYRCGRIQISERHKESFRTKEFREKISKDITEHPRGGVRSVKYYDYTRKDRSVVKVRGSYEVRFASFLDRNDYEWEYARTLYYQDKNGVTRRARPDFYLPKFTCFFETKGYLSEEQREKLDVLRTQLSVRIVLIFESDLRKLEKQELTLETFIGL